MSTVIRGPEDNVLPLFGQSMRLPPTNIPAEQALLGAIMANNKAYDRVSEFLRSEHFADPIHGRIYAAIIAAINQGQTADAVTLKSRFEHSGTLEEVGGIAYLAQLLSAVVSPTMSGEYGRTVFDAWQRRRAIEVGQALVGGAWDGSISLAEAMRQAGAGLDAIGDGASTDRTVTSLDDAIDQALDAADRAAKGGGPVGLSTGFHALDDALGGMEPGTLNILAGRAGMGKSSLGHQIALNIARSGVGVVELSLEMSAMQLGRRALSIASGVPGWKMRRGLHGPDVERLIAARTELRGLPLSIEDGSGLTASMIRTKVRQAQRRHGVGLVMVDHLHIVRPEEGDVRAGATYAVGQISQAHKRLAKEFDVPVLLLAQLSRAPDSRDDHRPVLSDLRQSGDIEQDADSVMFVYRPEYYLPKAAPERSGGEIAEKHEKRIGEWHEAKQRLAGVAEVILAKVREGEDCVVPMRFHGATTSFSEVTDGR